MNLTDKTVVVTGASSGIGMAIARDLSAAGANLVLTARRAAALEELAASLPGRTTVLAADITDPETPARLHHLAREAFERVDVLVNNAGILAMGSVDEVDIDVLTRMVRVNFEAVVRSSYVFGRAFKAQKSGAIINVSSISAFMTTAMTGVYSGTKMAVENLTASLRIELGASGVKVGSIAPGSTQTEMLTDLRGRIGVPVEVPAMQPEAIAAAVRFMLEQPDQANIAALRIYSSTEVF